MFKLFWAKKQNYFSKAVCVPPTWSDHFCSWSHLKSIRQSVAATLNQSGNRWQPPKINQAIGGSHLKSIRQSVAATKNQSGNRWQPPKINQAILGFCLFFVHLFHIIHSALFIPLYSFRFIHWLLYSFVYIIIMCIIYYALYSSVCIVYYVHYLFMHTLQWYWAYINQS